MPNPWNLSEREAQVMDSIARVGRAKIVAREIGISPRAVEHQAASAKKKMGAQSLITAAVAWDRYVREQIEEKAETCS